MTSRILVTGGTGTLGRHVVPLLQDAGPEVRVLSHHLDRATAGIEQVTGDLATGEGIDAAVQGTDVVLHLAGSAKGDDVKAMHLEAVGKHRPILPLPLPGKANRGFRAGANLAPEGAVGRRTWEEFLAGQVSAPTPSRSGSAQGRAGV